MKKLLKECACCGTRVQSNIVLKWKRNIDEKVFHICALCAEQGKVSDVSVYETTNHDDYTTYVKEVKLHLLDDVLLKVLKNKAIPMESCYDGAKGELSVQIDGKGYDLTIVPNSSYDRRAGEK